ncbi:SRPBCC domain-containing protein [Paraburkholderia sp. SARCC-3016]|uniref:CoxG family protein n=1 Tax=Paraburkholderia sp. SARCC-3016 TaxID=3058611 RepID=UPI002808BD0B|nr:SRPBCC domain-containing protein [Paraburkholderia sp. SARCC-3016]MDQ7975775.1 SRPBCC domain-containing protein [Paraburkholderia sp. SARCC-3016]
MELTNALRVPLAQSEVWDAMQDLALLRASLDNCESFTRLAGGEYALTLTVPLGPLRAHYEVRAHVASDNGTAPDRPHRTLNFKARAGGVGSLRGQIDVALRADDEASDKAPSTRIDYSVWATSTGPLAELPARQIENALHELADDFFTEFCAVVQAKHGQGPNQSRGTQPRRQHVFLRPISLAGVARRTRHDHGGALTGRAMHSTFAARAHHDHTPHVVPHWAWAAMIFFVALLLYVARWFSAS